MLPVPYFHVVFTLPAAIAEIAYQNKAVIYNLLFKASSETLLRIAADPKHLGCPKSASPRCSIHARFQAKWPPVRRPESAPTMDR